MNAEKLIEALSEEDRKELQRQLGMEIDFFQRQHVADKDLLDRLRKENQRLETNNKELEQEVYARGRTVQNQAKTLFDRNEEIERLKKLASEHMQQIFHLQDKLKQGEAQCIEMQHRLDTQAKNVQHWMSKAEKLEEQLDSFNAPDFKTVQQRLKNFERENEYLREQLADSNNLKINPFEVFAVKEDVPSNEGYFVNNGKVVGKLVLQDDGSVKLFLHKQ